MPKTEFKFESGTSYKPQNVISLNQNRKVTIFELLESNRSKKEYRNLMLKRSLNAFFTYRMFVCISRGRPFRTLFWAALNIPLTMFNYMDYDLNRKSVKKIDLYENGQFVDIYTINGFAQKKVPISNISAPSKA